MSKRMVFVTGHEFGLRALEGIVASSPYLAGELEVSLTIGLDASLSHRTVGYRSPGLLARENGIAHIDTVDGSLRATADRIRADQPDYLAVIGWSRLVEPRVLSIPRAGGTGMHPTCLPIGRGQAPIPWTIIKALRRTALTVFFLSSTADSGPVIAQYPLEVRPAETATSLFYRFAQLHFQAGMELAHQLTGPTVVAHPQDDRLATVWPRRRPIDGLLRPDMTKAEVERTVRALGGPYPDAFIELGGTRVAIRRAFLPESLDRRPACHTGSIPFECADGTILLLPQNNPD
ncbi:formyltransferase family protein [Streptomyces tendae]|uniref:formyltransferase family protein n=1 Tax=Streptomyces tendae TaxID=1932 RepID=UPI0024923965|nr:formyltransferase family protein [Streptomyces tendae]